MRQRLKRQRWKRITALVAALSLTMTTLPVVASEVLDIPISEHFGGNGGNQVERVAEYPRYVEYQKEHMQDYADVGAAIIVTADTLPEENSDTTLNEINGKNAFYWTNDRTELTWEFEINEAGLYTFALDYYLDGDKAYTAKRNLCVDGEVPFEEAMGMTFKMQYKENDIGKVNSYGDEIRGKNRPVSQWQTFEFTDSSGICDAPFEIYFEAGTHSVTLIYEEKDMYVGDFCVRAARQLQTYEKIKEEYQKKGYRELTETELTFEAEDKVAYTNDVTIRRENSSDVTVTPYDYTIKYLNVYGGQRWDNGNQEIAWTVSVPASGLYKIGFRALANMTDGLPVYRQIAIDGEVPFAEMLSYKFAYKSSYTTYELADEEGEAYLFYLEEGEHILSMTVKQGEMASVITSIEEDMAILSDMQLEIKKLAGSDIDPNYDYLFFKNIPELEGQFETLIASLKEKITYLKACTGGNPSVASSMNSILAQLEDMVENPFSIAKNYTDLESAQTTLGTWYTALLSAGMQMDKIYINSIDTDMKNAKRSIWKTLWANVVALWSSFTRSYNSISGSVDEIVEITDEIDVWVARGTEWAQAIKNLADENFTPATGILVNVKTVPSSQLNSGSANVLLLSITAGKQPDVALAVSSNTPIEFAIRDAVVDLTQFDDYDNVASQFYAETLVPYKYRNGIYGLPETMDFKALFYRKDIISDLGISIPETRDEFYAQTLPALYNAGYEFYYPRDEKSFILQYGGAFYTEDGSTSALDSPEVYEGLKEATELYTQYEIPVSASFYNRFRTGEMPMGIGDYSLYLQLLTAAPEISGLWGIALIPGLKKEDGTIDRTVSSFNCMSDMILSKTEKEKQSWEFLKWWSSTETQIAFCQEIEASLGTEARWNTANIEAFESLAWKHADLKVIQAMMETDREIPNVVGGYYTTRHMTNLWNKVVVSGENLRNALEEAVLEINKELRMKQEEYGITYE